MAIPIRKILFAVFASLPLTGMAQGEEMKGEFTIPRTLLKLAPLQFFNNTLDVGVESFNKSFTRSFDGSISFRSNASEFEKGRGVSLEIGYRKYVAPMKMHTRKDRLFYQGIYYNIAVRGTYFKAQEGDPNYPYYDPDIEIRSIAPSITIGLQKTLWQIIFLDVYVGGGIKFTEIEDNPQMSFVYYGNGIFDVGYDGIYPKIGAKIGVGL